MARWKNQGSIENTEKVFRSTLYPTEFVILSQCERKVKSKVRSVLVYFVSKPIYIQGFTLGNRGNTER